MQFLNLDGTWKVYPFEGLFVPEAYCGESVQDSCFIDASVPGEVHLDLERAGWIKDCNKGLEALSARWVEEQIWVYRKEFDVPEEAAAQHTWLVFDGLDLNSIIYLNGNEIGRHNNAFVPCRLNVTGKVRAGKNVIAVQIESGLYSISEKPGECYCPWTDHKLHKRAWLRKPQYQFTWDWNPRLVNVGIWKSVRLEWTDSVRIDSLTIYPELFEGHQSAKIHTSAYIENPSQTGKEAKIRINILETGAVAERCVNLPAGITCQKIAVDVQNPELWWPRPHGKQPLYTVRCEVDIDGTTVDSTTRRTGIRSIRINQKPHPESGSYFILEVNGKPIFAKGGNWVPPDMIYAKLNPERYKKLVEIAVDANFNALRIWGGGLYADNALLDACDEMGVLVWHDFIFACSKYPGDDPDFLRNVREEVGYIARELSPHPSLLVWCGNNELEWGAWDWGYDNNKPHPDYALYHFEIPRILKREDPSRPYWPSSPYSLDSCHPNEQTCGDQHPWHVSIGEYGPDFWAYRNDASRFPNEGGVLGATSPKTVNEFLPDGQRNLHSPGWNFHDNSINQNGLTYKALDFWLGLKANNIAFEDYLFYSGVLQSEGLQEYINNYRRRMFSSSSAIFWMYNDSWPVSHGWTIVDYYLRKKLAYHPVRRAFTPIQIVPAVEQDKVLIFGVNDLPTEWNGELRYGLFKMSGGIPVDTSDKVTLPPNSSALLGSFDVKLWKSIGTKKSAVFALLMDETGIIAQNRLFIERFKDMEWAEPDIRVEKKNGKAVFSSDTFAWGVCLDFGGESDIRDNIFDLIPGVPYEVDWPSSLPEPVVQRTASAFRNLLGPMEDNPQEL